jgi:hypothetical protein
VVDRVEFDVRHVQPDRELAGEGGFPEPELPTTTSRRMA